MKAQYNKSKKIPLVKSQGLSYDLTLCFNTIKETKAASQRFKKRQHNIINIINPTVEPLIILNTYELEEKINELRQISKCYSVNFSLNDLFIA